MRSKVINLSLYLLIFIFLTCVLLKAQASVITGIKFTNPVAEIVISQQYKPIIEVDYQDGSKIINPSGVVLSEIGSLLTYKNGIFIGAHSGNTTINANYTGFTTSLSVYVNPTEVLSQIDTFLITPADNSRIIVPVVVINYFPTNDGINLDIHRAPPGGYYGYGNATTLDQAKSLSLDRQKLTKFALEEGSKFRNFNGLNNSPEVGVQVVAYVNVYETNYVNTNSGSYLYVGGNNTQGSISGVNIPDVRTIFSNIGLQNLVNNKGVREVWFNLFPISSEYPLVTQNNIPQSLWVNFWESYMSSPTTGNVSNSDRNNSILPVYNSTYVVYGYNLARTQAENIHNHGHQIEAQMDYIDRSTRGNGQRLFWDQFVGYPLNGNPTGRCGDTHFSPNSTVDYDWNDIRSIMTDIKTWKPSGGTFVALNDSAWMEPVYKYPIQSTFTQASLDGDSQYRWLIYWFQSIPGYKNNITYNDTVLSDWWDIFYNWDTANSGGKTLWQTSSPLLTPAAPMGISLNPVYPLGTGGLTVNITPPNNPGTSPIMSYTITVKPTTTGTTITKTIPSNQTQVVITGLNDKLVYTVSVAAANASGVGAYTVGTYYSPLGITMPALLQDLYNQTVTLGDPLTLNVFATGASLNYQWFLNGLPIAGATSASYSIPSASGSDQGIYTVVISNNFGSTTSTSATLTVLGAAYGLPASSSITSSVIVSANLNLPFSYKVELQTNPTTFILTGVLPIGLTFNTSTGVISGTPTVSGTYSFIVSATNSSGTGTYKIALSLNYSATSSSGIMYSDNSGFITVTGYTGTGGPVVVPSSINGDPVTSIASYAFQNCTSITSLTIQGNLNSIGSYAFQGASSLQSITFASSVSFTVINPHTFEGCGSLTSINIPTSVTSIGSYAFNSCTNLKTVGLPSGLVSIGDGAFQSSGLTAIIIPNSVVTIGNNPFGGCNNLTQINVLSGSTHFTSINGVLFNFAQTLLIGYPIGNSATNYTISSSVTQIGDFAFYGCSNLKSVRIPSSVSIIGTSSFAACSAILVNIVAVPVVTSTLIVSGVVGVNLNYQITALNLPVSYLVTGLLPNGLKFDTANGIIAGIPTESGSYVVTIGAVNSGGTGTSSLTLTIVPALVYPTINLQPTSQSINSGSSATFSVTVTGSTPTYQWYFNNLPISGATSATYSIANAQTSNAGLYTVAVTNAAGTVTSQAAQLTVISPIAISTQPQSKSVLPGTSVSLSVTATGTSPTYQWYLNNIAIPGATSSTYTIPSALASNAGTYSVTVSNNAGTVASQAAQLSVLNPGRLTNLSVLSLDGPGSQLLTIGFVSGGAGVSGSQNLLIRASGPAIGVAPFGVPNVLPDPTLTVFNSSTVAVASNDNWGTPASNATAVTAADTATGAFALTSTTSLDAAVVTNLNAGSYTVQVSGKNGASGNVIAEVYDNTPANSYTISTPRLVNISCLEQVASGGVLTAGFVIAGSTPEQVLIRASGPTLAAAPFNLTGTIADPKLTVFNSSSTVLATNTGWGGSTAITAANNATGAFQFVNSTSKDSAVLLTLQPGAYTVQATSASGIAGLTLIEVYEVPASF